MTGFITQYKGLRRENYIIAFGRFVTCLGSMIWPMLTLILTQKMGLDAGEASWVIAAGGILMLPALLLGGKIADRFNKRNTIVCMDILSVICYLTCALIPLSWTSMGLMFAGSVFQNMEHPSYSALTADLCPTADREKSYSLQYLGSNLGLAAAPTLAGFLIQDHLDLIFLINGISIACSTLIIFFGIRDVTPVRESGRLAEYQKERSGVSIWRVLLESPVLLVFIAVYCGYYALYQMYVYLIPLDMVELHGSSGYVIYGTFTSVNCLVVVLFTPVVTRSFASMADSVKAVFGVLMLEIGYGIFLLFKGTVPVYYIAMTIITLGEIFAMLAENPYLTKRVPATHRGRINGAETVMRTATASVFQVLIGHIYAGSGVSAAWTAVMLTGAVFIAVSVIMVRMDRKAYADLYSTESGESA